MTIFDKRPKGHGPFFVGQDFRPVAESVNVGDTVTLHLDGILVVVTVTKHAGDIYNGTVTGFEGFTGGQHKGIREGSSVEFSFDNVFGCGKKT